MVSYGEGRSAVRIATASLSIYGVITELSPYEDNVTTVVRCGSDEKYSDAPRGLVASTQPSVRW